MSNGTPRAMPDATSVARIEQIAVGMPAPIGTEDATATSGIVKRPVAGPVNVGWENLAGDGQADLSVHGGRDKAIYVYSAEHYVYWRDELGRELEVAQFGENLTVTGLTEDRVVIGSRLRVGSTEVVVAQPRLPCFKLGLRLHDSQFPARFLTSGRLGFYLRVEKTGQIIAGDAFELLDQPRHGLTVQRLWELVFVETCVGANCAAVRGALTELVYLDSGWQRRLRGRLRAGGCE